LHQVWINTFVSWDTQARLFEHLSAKSLNFISKMAVIFDTGISIAAEDYWVEA
jgi:hypothetical protein